jgi:LuxR family maltose regulon positive regulatory protein
LCIYQAWALNLTGQVEDVESWLRRAEECLEQIPFADGLRKGRAGWGYIATIRAHLAILRNDAPRAIQLCHQAFEDLDENDVATRSGAAFLLGNARLIGGDLENVNSAWAEAAHLGKISSSLLITAASLDGMTYLAIMRGELHKAESICREEIQLAASSRGQPLPLATHALARLAALQYEWNELGMALSNAEKSVELSRILARPNYIIQSHNILVRLRLAQGDLSGALALLYEVEQVAGRYALTLVADSLLAAMKIRLWIAKGDLKAGEGLAKERDIEVGKKLNHMHESEYLLYVRILFLQGKTEDALALQKQILQEFESFGWQGRVIETLVLRAMILQARGNLPLSLDALEKALGLAESEGYIRVFLDEGAAMADLLRRVGSRGVASRYAARLLAQFEKEPGMTAAAKQPLIEPLSEREFEVLSLLAGGLSNQNIAERLFVSIGTVKAHTASIYRKLDVNSRTQAIARSKDLGLL